MQGEGFNLQPLTCLAPLLPRWEKGLGVEGGKTGNTAFELKLTAMASCPPLALGGQDAHPTRDELFLQDYWHRSLVACCPVLLSTSFPECAMQREVGLRCWA
jgi:hypothetical protein